MTGIKLTIHGTGGGVCCLTGKETDGLTLSFEDNTVKESFLSWKAFRQLLALKANQGGKTQAPRVPVSAPVETGNP